MTSILIFIACLVVFVFGMYSDISVSRLYVYYSKSEDNKLVQNERGQLSMTKVWIVPGIEIGAAILFGLLGHYLQSDEQWGNVGLLSAGMTLAGAGIAHYLISRKNAKQSRYNRIQQIALREQWKASGLPGSLTTRERNGYHWHSSFAWIYTNSIEDLRVKLAEWLTVPDEQAWPDKTYHPK